MQMSVVVGKSENEYGCYKIGRMKLEVNRKGEEVNIRMKNPGDEETRCGQLILDMETAFYLAVALLRSVSECEKTIKIDSKTCKRKFDIFNLKDL